MKRLSIIIVLFFSTVVSGAQSISAIDSVLAEIEVNNKRLQALALGVEAETLEIKSQNNWQQGIGLEYSPFWAPGQKGMNSDEFVATIGFDFPTKYFVRGKSVKLQTVAVNKEYQEARRDLLLEAKLICIDLISMNKKKEFYEERLKNTQSILKHLEDSYENGDVRLVDLNKGKMEMMHFQTELVENEVERIVALEELKALNGNIRIDFDETEYPEAESILNYDEFFSEIMSSELSLQAAEANVDAAAQEIKVNKQNWVPELEVGYRRNAAGPDDVVDGLLVGASLPILSGRHLTKAAKIKHQQAVVELEDMRVRKETEISVLYNELLHYQVILDTYDEDLMYSTLKALSDEVHASQMSVIEYYTEADHVYSNLQARLDIENRYRQILAEVFKNRL